MREPRPWYWRQRKAWYVHLDGKHIPLGPDLNPCPKGEPRPRQEIMQEYYDVMAARGRTSEEDLKKATVADVCARFLRAKSGGRESSQNIRVAHLKPFIAVLRDRPFRSIGMEDVQRIVKTHDHWAKGTKHAFVAMITQLFRWAREAGYLPSNPFAGQVNPYPKVSRKRCMHDEEYAALVNEAKDPEFQNAMLFLKGTGCRPGELRVIEAKHLHPTKRVVTLEPELHKTGGRTDKDRTIVMPREVNLMVRELANRYPTGPLFRNSRNGQGWSKGCIRKRVERYRKRLGLRSDLVPYLLRHKFATDNLRKHPAPLVAKMMGHGSAETLRERVNTDVLNSVYYQVELDEMIEACDETFTKKG